MKENNMIKISIIVPVYNAMDYLDECIQSVLQQSYPCFEMILVNDGSTDDSGEICNRYAENHSKVFVYHKENQGQLYARQYGVDRAKGDYCVFLDADDYLDKDALEIIAAKIHEVKCDCIVYGMKRKKEDQTISYITNGDEYLIDDKRNLYRKCFFSFEYNSMCRKAAKTDLLKNRKWNDFYDIRYGEDLLQSIELLKVCKNVLFIKENIYNYRVNEKSITNSINSTSIEVDNPVRPFLLEFIKNEQVFSEQDYKEYISYCIDLLINKIFMVAELDESVNAKVELYKRIKSTSYYQELLSYYNLNLKKFNKQYILLLLFKNSCYFFIGFIVKIKKWIKHI